MAHRRESGGDDGPSWLCPLCDKQIEVGDAFTLLLVRARPPEISRNIPAHLSCNIATFADEVADAVVDALAAGDDDDDEARQPSDLQRELRRRLTRVVSGIFTDFFGG